LQLYRAGHRIHHTWKFRENAITRKFNDPSSVLGDLSINETSSHLFECCERAGLVRAHQPAISHYVGSKNCSEAAFHCCVEELKGKNREMLTRASNRFNGSTLH